MHPAALSHDDLVALTGYQRAADIERWCHRHGVRYFRGRAGIWTTLDAVNSALGLRSDRAEPPPQRLEF
jgi:hypothetical protein